MKRIIPAIILATAAVTAQAKEVVLECSVDSDSKKVVMMVDAEAGKGSFDEKTLTLTAKNSTIYQLQNSDYYVKTGSAILNTFWLQLDRTKLTISYFGIDDLKSKATHTGSCKVVQSKAQI
jgi:hypothetical protein